MLGAASDSPMADLATPCVRICTLDRASGLCLGCGRSANEIAQWIACGEVERDRIMRELPRRLDALRTRKANSVQA